MALLALNTSRLDYMYTNLHVTTYKDKGPVWFRAHFHNLVLDSAY